jgi:hypothetical protein
MNLAPKQVCQLCEYDDEFVAAMVSPDGEAWLYACASPAHDEPHTWESKIAHYVPGREGACEDLGLYDDLEHCVLTGEPWVEYGVVEHRYKLHRPDVYFGEMLARWGHRANKPQRSTLSGVIAGALGQLSREGALVGRFGKATAYWSYNGKISYWAKPPAPPAEPSITWQSFAEADPTLDPNTWKITPPQ